MPDIRPQKTAIDRYLTFPEREEIALLKAKGHCVREIARRIGRAASTQDREQALVDGAYTERSEKTAL